MDRPTQNDVLEPGEDDRDVDRRTFLAGAGAGALTGAVVVNQAAQAAVFRTPSIIKPRSLLANPIPLLEGVTGRTTSISVHRREDMLSLRFDAINMKRRGQNLVKDVGSQPSYLVVTFAPQHLTEQAYFETKANSGTAGGNEPPDPPGQASALLAAPSRIAFQVPHGHSIPYTLGGLLDWSKLDLSLAPAASYTPHLPLFILGRRRGHKHHKRSRAHAAALSPLPAHLGAPPVLPTTFRAPTILQLGSGIPEIRAPEPTETSIELPWHLAISPTAGAKFSHQTKEITSNGTTELWHTRLANSSGLGAADGGALRAVWNFDTKTRDFATPGDPTLSDKNNPPNEAELGPFRMSLTPNDRWQIVHLTSDFTLNGRADVQAKKLWLTARGGFLDSEGNWDEITRSLAAWKHLATQGRDHYVKVTIKGFLFPFGHPAVKIVVTERQLEQLTPGGEIVATLRQFEYIVIRKAIMSYDPSQTFGIANNSRDWPFRSVECKTARTPPLDLPVDFTETSFGIKDTNFVPVVGGTPFKWSFVGTDWVGREIPFTAQAVFVGYDDATDPLASLIVRNHYNSIDSNDPLRTAEFHGKPIAYAQSLSTGDTDLHTKTMSFGCAPGLGGTQLEFQTNNTAHCYPTLAPSINGFDTGAQAVVRLAAAEAISGGQPLNGNASPTVAYYPPYVSTGFSTSQQVTGNAGNVFMEILFNASNASNLTFGGGSAGGVMTPNLQLQGISRSLGPVADLDNIFGGKFDPNSIFAGLSADLQAKVLGGVTLADLLAPVDNFLDGGTPEVPNPQALRIGYSTNGTVVTTTLTWKPNVRTDNPVITPTQVDEQNTSFELDATITTDLANPNNSNYSIVGTLKSFAVSLISTDPSDQFITVTFKELTFTSSSSQKVNTDVTIHAVTFQGPLKFVEQLSEFMSFGGGSGLKIQLQPTGLYADLLIELPTIAVGLFTLSHVGIDANFTLPYDGSAAVFGFGFSTRNNPFQLSIAIFGGGGYFMIKIGTDGLHEIDAGFDFGAMAAINLGVASGSVSLTAGFQYTYMVDPMTGHNKTTLTGYVKLQGSLSILGIITMSLTFDLSLTYVDNGGGASGGSSVTGTASVTLSISILFFSFSVTATATKTFENSGGGGHAVHGNAVRAHIGGTPGTNPTFADQMTSTDWTDYCAAFAA